MATHSSILTWKIPWTEECGELQSMGLQRIWHDLVTKGQQSSLMKCFFFFHVFCPFSNCENYFLTIKI